MPHLKQARKIFKEVREFLLHPDPEIQPLRIPVFDYTEEYFFFLALMGDDKELSEKAIFVRYQEGEGSVIGVALKVDEKMWLGPDGQKHLKSPVMTFDVESYVQLAIEDFLME